MEKWKSSRRSKKYRRHKGANLKDQHLSNEKSKKEGRENGEVEIIK